ncbi:MAG: hypothetical protein JWN64_341 [Parcubacteria group bacterium]|nr:hypothetical protein [Parcubacteria group bacterium]
MPEKILGPHTKDDERQKAKREGPNGKPGAGRIDHKGGAGSSNKATGGKGAR